MKAFVWIALIVIAAGALTYLRIDNWERQMSVYFEDNRRIFDEAQREGNYDEREPEVIANNRKISELMHNKPWLPLLPAERITLESHDKKLAEYDARQREAARPTIDEIAAQLPVSPQPRRATPMPAAIVVPRRTPSPQQQALDIARKYGSPK